MEAVGAARSHARDPSAVPKCEGESSSSTPAVAWSSTAAVAGLRRGRRLARRGGLVDVLPARCRPHCWRLKSETRVRRVPGGVGRIHARLSMTATVSPHRSGCVKAAVPSRARTRRRPACRGRAFPAVFSKVLRGCAIPTTVEDGRRAWDSNHYYSPSRRSTRRKVCSPLDAEQPV